jgi:ribosomal protein L19
MLYFLLKTLKKKNKIEELIKERRNRKNIFTLSAYGKVFTRGDILTVNSRIRTLHFMLQGICLSQKKKTLTKPNTTFNIRNVLFGVGVEMSISYYYSRIFMYTKFADHKRKSFSYRAAKLYYLCNRVNKATRVK